MAMYPIKMLKDEEGNAFVPLTSSEALKTPDGKTLDEKLQNKLETTNIKAGTDINITIDGNNVTINNASKGVLIDNLTTETSGVGSLDAHQGKILKDMIPEVVNDITSTDGDKALSAYQGYLLSGKVVPTGGKEGQVLKKSSDTNWSLEWGDAADPNAIVGDGSIKKIVELTYEEYKELEAAEKIDEETEYHVIDGFASQSDFEKMIKDVILATKPIGSIEINTSGVNPAIYIGGEWISWGSGQVPVGVNASDADFATAEKTGGDKMHTHNYSHTHGVPGVAHTHSTGNHTLTVSEMPSHTHAFRAVRDYPNTDSGGSLPKANNGQGNNSGWSDYVTTAAIYANQHTGGSSAHNHGDTGSTTPSATTTNSQSTNISESSSNLQPYITCYMWKRIS